MEWTELTAAIDIPELEGYEFGEDSEGQVVINTGWYQDPDDPDNLYRKYDREEEEVPSQVEGPAGPFDPESSQAEKQLAQMVTDIPLARSSSQIVTTRNPDGGQIQAAAERIQEFVEGSWFSDLAEEAVGESYLDEERAALTSQQIGAIRHTIIGRALLYVAEQELIQAAGLVED